MFDLNRRTRLESLVTPGPRHAFKRMTAMPALPFHLTVVGNRGPDSGEVREADSQPARGTKDRFGSQAGAHGR